MIASSTLSTDLTPLDPSYEVALRDDLAKLSVAVLGLRGRELLLRVTDHSGLRGRKAAEAFAREVLQVIEKVQPLWAKIDSITFT
jgi:hypothetical protein